MKTTAVKLVLLLVLAAALAYGTPVAGPAFDSVSGIVVTSGSGQQSGQVMCPECRMTYPCRAPCGKSLALAAAATTKFGSLPVASGAWVSGPIVRPAPPLLRARAPPSISA